MPPSRDHLDRISRLRDLFLDDARGRTALRDYWRDTADLQAYDDVLAARIGWKWDAALAECRDRGMARTDELTVLDFGCGTGIAARRFVAQFGAREVLCHDRSPAAMTFAAAALNATTPDVSARELPDVTHTAFDVLLISHVLGELDDRGIRALHPLIERAQRVILVEPGNHSTSRRLSQLRKQLLTAFHVIAPCPHAASCPALDNSTDWCHFFAAPPPEVFTDGEWVKTARELHIDLRSLPYAFLALDRTEASGASPPPAHRVLGRPHVGRREINVQLCTATGLAKVAVSKRSDADTWRALKKHPETIRALPDPS